MQPIFPRGLTWDTSLPESLKQPGHAERYVGRKVCRLRMREEEMEESAWYIGVVDSVDFDEDSAFFKVVYHGDGSAETLPWDEFRSWAVVDAPVGVHAPRKQSPCRPSHSDLQTTTERPQQPPDWRDDHGVGPSAGYVQHAQPGTEPLSHGSNPLPLKRKAHTMQGKLAQPSSQQACGQGHPIVASQQVGVKEADTEHERDRPTVRRRPNMESEGLHQHIPRTRQSHTGRPRHILGDRENFSAGQLCRIQLVNFMCHENVEVFFNKHVTFVAGRNGSGKSALLQGLQACLGASARETGRGKSLANWVAKERHSATVTLDIWNTTEDEVETQKWPPFRHEIYGSMIRIVRKITAGEAAAEGNRKGSATYQLFRADGLEFKPQDHLGHSASREVEMLSEHFNIDASNPLIVITQDVSREFHQLTQGSSRCKKYDMYMSGTCLTATRDKLAAAAVNVQLATENMKKHVGRFQAKQKELKGLQQRQKILQQTDLYKQLLADLDLAIVWAIVEEARGGLAIAKTAAAAHPERVHELKAAVEEDERAEAELQTQEDALRDEMNNTRSDELLVRVQETSNRHKAARRREAEAARRLEVLRSLMRGLYDRKASLEEDLERLDAERQSEGLLQRVREHEAKVAAEQAELADLQAAATRLEASCGELSKRLKEAEATLRRRSAEAGAAEAQAREARAAHHEVLQALGGDRAQARAVNVRKWGAKVMDLLDAVRTAPPGTFSQPPIGPLGLHLRLRADCDPALGPLVELALRGCLSLWVVNRREDCDKLRGMADRLRCQRPYVVQMEFRSRPHDYGQQAVVDSRGRVWRRVIDLVEPMEGLLPQVHGTVINVLLDHGSAGSVVLVGSMEEGQEVALGRNPDLVSRRVRRAYDSKGASYVCMRAGAMRTDFLHLPRTCRLAADNRAQLVASEQALRAREAELQQAEVARRESQIAVTALQHERHDLEQQQMTLSRKQACCQSQLDSLLDEAPSEASEAHSSERLNGLQQTQRELAEAISSQASLETDKNNAAAEAEAIHKGIEALHKQKGEYVARRQELVVKINQLAQRKQEAGEQLRARREQLQAASEDMQKARQRIDQYAEEVEKASEAATQVCSRQEGLDALVKLREVKRQELRSLQANRNRSEEEMEALLAQAMTRQSLERWAAVMKQKISQAEANAGGDLCSISLKVAAAQTDLDRERAALDSVGKEVNAMQEAQMLRAAKYQTLVQQVEHVSNAKFGRYMQRRNIIASLHLDHEEERLHLHVRKNHERERATSLMQLSGGERSFTTSSFLLAMGEVLDTPFRAMDEYDVYMDQNTRKLATIALLEYAWRSNPTSQLVLLSPQDTAMLSEAIAAVGRACERDGVPLPSKDFARIVKLRNPRST
ncbi:hypothetical protein VaNZ11_000321 [Volvox africanus]|uniref:Rad50/SbcC-type AAA domain-containing protein n=1 Tax=Volvox africanus TaxID=51714 RepID=A0ABQ5RLV8_9CHLO|nr:hypothetical protein VaNZ11_000321 [Volvox africanus]